MKSQLLADDGSGNRTFLLVLEPGAEVPELIQRFARETGLTGASFTAIGAFEDVTLGFFDLERKEYLENRLPEQVEVLVLAGNIGLHEGQPKVHAHVVVGRRDGSAAGGHLLRGRVRPTLELIIRETPAALRRRLDPETGLPLIQPGN